MKVGSYLPSFYRLLAEFFTVYTSPKLVHSLSKHLLKVLLSISGIKNLSAGKQRGNQYFLFSASVFNLSPLFLLISVVLTRADSHLLMWQELVVVCEVVTAAAKHNFMYNCTSKF